ncbi:MAG TPA: hypothetical protein DCX77_05785 [Acidimicrobiaceae bacterium]|nr:hypothetical protein [Acidimicrobiaceae bacterium]HAX05171.1 hypothetical protein [Acidimicrobiaceae bacterium]|tara:strand:+ start:260 stop:880 length:621 start_codon:yes stop_codon:yes gene_type:complete
MRPDLEALARKARGFMPHDEGMGLYQTALQLASPDTIVEIGSYCGKSTIYLGAAALENGSVVFTIDHHRGSEEMQQGWEHHDAELVDPSTGKIDSLPELRRNIEVAGLENVVVPIIGESQTVAKRWAGPVSMLFIDGGHGSEPAHTDYEEWTPKVIAGGFLAIHDVFSDPADGGRPPYEIYSRALEDGGFEIFANYGSLQILRRSF